MNALLQLWLAVRRAPGVTALAVIGVALLAVNYQLYQERAAAALAHEEIRQRGETMLSFLADRTRIESDLAAVREALQQIDDQVVREESKEVNLGYFYRVEKATRVRINRIDQLAAEPAPSGAAYRAVPVTVRTTGTYRNLLAFIREVETGPRVMRVTEFSMERLTEGTDDLGVTLTLDMLAQP